MNEQKELKVETRNLGDLFRQIRIAQRLSQESVALDIGVAVSTIERIENGKVSQSSNPLKKF